MILPAKHSHSFCSRVQGIACVLAVEGDELYVEHIKFQLISCCSSVVERGIAVTAIILRSVVRPSVAAFLLLESSKLYARALRCQCYPALHPSRRRRSHVQKIRQTFSNAFLSIEEGISFMRCLIDLHDFLDTRRIPYHVLILGIPSPSCQHMDNGCL
jgi:hypothetical protein